MKRPVAAHSLRYVDPRPATVTIDGATYATTALLRCEHCPLVLVHYTDPDARGAAPRAAHGLRLDELTTGRVPGCGSTKGELACPECGRPADDAQPHKLRCGRRTDAGLVLSADRSGR